MNSTIIDQFKLLVRQITMDIDMDTKTGKKRMINMYRLRAIKHALEEIQKYPNKITSSEQLNIKGIGKGIVDRIDEILKTGKLSEINLKDNHLDLVEKLETIFGIGRKKAYELIREYNVTSIDDMKKKHKNKTITLPHGITIGLEYHDKIKEHIPREEIDNVYTLLTKTLSSIDPLLFGIICGSYRRLNEYSNDVDYIIVHPNLVTKDDVEKHDISYLNKVILALKKQKFIIESLTGDDVKTKYMGLYNSGQVLRRIDIRFIPYESYYSAILYFTGSKDFNKKMRSLAINMDYKLNEYGLFDEHNKMIHVASEKEIFDILNMEYLTPDQR